MEELLHKSNNMLSMIVKKNTSYLHVWNGFLSSDPDDASTQAYLESAQQQLGFAEFYFLSYDGNYMTPAGKRATWACRAIWTSCFPTRRTLC